MSFTSRSCDFIFIQLSIYNYHFRNKEREREIPSKWKIDHFVAQRRRKIYVSIWFISFLLFLDPRIHTRTCYLCSKTFSLVLLHTTRSEKNLLENFPENFFLGKFIFLLFFPRSMHHEFKIKTEGKSSWFFRHDVADVFLSRPDRISLNTFTHAGTWSRLATHRSKINFQKFSDRQLLKIFVWKFINMIAARREKILMSVCEARNIHSHFGI